MLSNARGISSVWAIATSTGAGGGAWKNCAIIAGLVTYWKYAAPPRSRAAITSTNRNQKMRRPQLGAGGILFKGWGLAGYVDAPVWGGAGARAGRAAACS